jgi:hypothetical protein
MKRKRVSCIFLLSAAVVCAFSLQQVSAHDQPAQDAPIPARTTQDAKPQKSAPHELWSLLKEGKISFSTRWRFESFERDGAPFTGTAEAPTWRIALGYETPAYRGFTVFAQGEAVIVTGAANYSIPQVPSQNRPDLPSIVDPKSLELSQAYVKWSHEIFTDKKMSLTLAGRNWR